MLKYDNTVSSTVDGKPIYGAQVTVLTADEPSNPQVATIYSDEDGRIPLSQPILTDQLGYFAFYIGDGKYDIRVMTGAVEISRTNITMVDTLSLKQRALVVPVNEDSGTLPPAGERAGKLLGFDSEGAPSMAVPNSFEGPTGPANSTYTTLAALKAAPSSNASYILTTTSGPVAYAYVAGNFTGRNDDVNVVKLDAVPLDTGALVRQEAATIATALEPDLPSFAVNRILSRRVSLDDFKTDSLTWSQAYAEALSRGYREVMLEDHDYVLGTNGLVVNQAGASLLGRGFHSVPDHTGVDSGTRLIYTGTDYAVRVQNADQAKVIERVRLEDFAIVPNVSLDPTGGPGGGVGIFFARHIDVSRLYFAGFVTGMYVNDQVWLSRYNNIGAYACRTAFHFNSGAEDSELFGLIGRGYSPEYIGFRADYQAQCLRLNTCDFSNNGIGAFISNGNIAGAGLQMHVELDNCIIETDRSAQDIEFGGAIVISSANAAIDNYPVVTVRHCRFLGNNPAGATQVNPCVRALAARSVIIEHPTETGYDHLVLVPDANTVGSVDVRGDCYAPRVSTFGLAASEVCTRYDGPKRPTKTGPFKQIGLPATTDWVNAWNLRQLTNKLTGPVAATFRVTLNRIDSEPRTLSEWIVTWGSFLNPEVKKRFDNSDSGTPAFVLRGMGDFIQIAQSPAPEGETLIVQTAEIRVEWVQ